MESQPSFIKEKSGESNGTPLRSPNEPLKALQGNKQQQILDAAQKEKLKLNLRKYEELRIKKES